MVSFVLSWARNVEVMQDHTWRPLSKKGLVLQAQDYVLSVLEPLVDVSKKADRIDLKTISVI